MILVTVLSVAAAAAMPRPAPTPAAEPTSQSEPGARFCLPETSPIGTPDPFIRLTMQRNLRFVAVEFRNGLGRPVQLLPQEWSLSIDGRTSPVVTGAVPDGMTQTASLAPVTLAPDDRWEVTLAPRSPRQSLDEGESFNRVLPPICRSEHVVTLNFVFLDQGKKVIGSARYLVILDFREP